MAISFTSFFLLCSPAAGKGPGGGHGTGFRPASAEKVRRFSADGRSVTKAHTTSRRRREVSGVTAEASGCSGTRLGYHATPAVSTSWVLVPGVRLCYQGRIASVGNSQHEVTGSLGERRTLRKSADLGAESRSVR